MGAAFFLLAACAGTSDTAPRLTATTIDAWAVSNGWQADRRHAGDFAWLSLYRLAPGYRRITVYIEGDGAAWGSPYHPPADPTPHRAVGLDLARRDKSGAAVYLGRPCQYLSVDALAACPPAYWLDRRFATEVIDAYAAQLDGLRVRFGAVRWRLVGYSGGGVIAALLAARRDDVDELVTIAAPLSLHDWVAHHALTPLRAAQDPAGVAADTRWPPMRHFAGGDDEVVPPVIVRAFTTRHGGALRVIDGADHACCWGPLWSAVLAEEDKELR